MYKIKVCGVTDGAIIPTLNKFIPDYVGFIMTAGFRRSVDEGFVKQSAARLARDIERVGVFVNDDIFRIARLVNDGIIDVVQLHGDEDGEYIGRLKALCPATVIKSVAVRGNDPVIYPDECDIVLLDAYSPSARGGTGQKVCWREYREVKKPVILAGGITPENVKRALAAVKPWGVDSSGGLETGGKKDARKVAQYISEIRECN